MLGAPQSIYYPPAATPVNTPVVPTTQPIYYPPATTPVNTPVVPATQPIYYPVVKPIIYTVPSKPVVYVSKPTNYQNAAYSRPAYSRPAY